MRQQLVSIASSICEDINFILGLGQNFLKTVEQVLGLVRPCETVRESLSLKGDEGIKIIMVQLLQRLYHYLQFTLWTKR